MPLAETAVTVSSANGDYGNHNYLKRIYHWLQFVAISLIMHYNDLHVFLEIATPPIMIKRIGLDYQDQENKGRCKMC